ncbi:MAG: gluconokinase, GntK/IdnK-type [Bacteroidota bacterium]
MGVSGCGKTTLGIRLAAVLGWRFIDAEDFHTPESLLDIETGTGAGTGTDDPLVDGDARAWTAALREKVAQALGRGEDTVLACSALKRGLRRILTVDASAVRFVYLKGSASLIRQRLRARSGHFLSAGVLASQFASLEEPDNAVTIDIDERPGRIVEQIREALAIAQGAWEGPLRDPRGVA